MAKKKPLKNTRRIRTIEKHESIRKRFREFDLSKHRLDFVLEKVAEEFYLSTETIYSIIKKTGYYK